MERRTFMQVTGKLGFLLTIERKFRQIFNRISSPVLPQSSYPKLPLAALNVQPAQIIYTPAGIGGGGAYAAYNISPYNSLRLVATDMGTIFRSPDATKAWNPISHLQAQFSSDLTVKSPIAFSPDGMVVLYSEVGATLQKSVDQGLTFTTIPFPFQKGELIKYFTIDSYCPLLIFAGTTLDLYTSTDQGQTWQSANIAYKTSTTNATGTFIDYPNAGNALRTVYHATGDYLYQLQEGGNWQLLSGPYAIRLFRGGRDQQNGLTLLFVAIDAYSNPGDLTTNIAVTVLRSVIQQNDDTPALGYGTIDYQRLFGFLNISTDSGITFIQLPNMGGGMHVCMAEDDAMTIYSTGGYGSSTQQGSKVWRSTNRGAAWNLVFLEENQTVYKPWPTMSGSAPGLDVGWNDDIFHSFTVNPRNALDIGGTNNYFLLTSADGGQTWLAPFTTYIPTPANPTPAKGQYWKTTGMENASVLRFKFHPLNSQLAYAAVSDMAGFVTVNAGQTFRITKTAPGSFMQYDYAFDKTNRNIVFAAAGTLHDWPENNPNYYAADGSVPGGIFKSSDQGVSWNQLTPQGNQFNIQFISIAYDIANKYIYGGTQGSGLAFSPDDGVTWQYLNNGLPVQSSTSSQGLIIAQIEIDPDNSDVYCLVAGNSPDFTNYNYTGIYWMDVNTLVNPGTAVWQHLGNPNLTIPLPNQVYWWRYPIGFVIDWTDASRKTIWLIDRKTSGGLNYWLKTGIWQLTYDQNQNPQWNFNQSFTNPRHICIDISVPGQKRIYVNGGWEVTPTASLSVPPPQGGSNGYGGPLHSDDNGVTWYKNMQVPLLSNGQCTVPDPNNPGSIFYTFFGGGFLHGPRPDQTAGTCQKVI